MVDFPQGMYSGITWLVESDDQLFMNFSALSALTRVALVPSMRIGWISLRKPGAGCTTLGYGDAVMLLENTETWQPPAQQAP